MTLRETATVMEILQTNWSAFARDRQEETLKLWAAMFADDPVELVLAAVKSLIVSPREFPPTIGVVKEQMTKLVKPNELTEQEAWNLIARATRNGVYGSKEEFEKLPPDLQRLVGSPEQLRAWALLESETLHSVVASNFQRSYKVMLERKKPLEALPSDVRVLISGMAETLSVDPPESEKMPLLIEGETTERCEPEKIRKILADAGMPLRLSEDEIQSRKYDMISRLRGE